MTRMIHKYFLYIVLPAAFLFAGLHISSGNAAAQEGAASPDGTGMQARPKDWPDLPDPIKNLVNEGAQIRYLGRNHGLDGWLTIKQGREQYYYVTPDRKAIVMGVMFDETGKLETVRQIQELRRSEGDALDTLTQAQRMRQAIAEPSGRQEFKTPGQRMYASVEAGNWIVMGDEYAPPVYAFIDPECPHCHDFIQDMDEAGYIDRGQIQIRILPVGVISRASLRQSAYLLAAPDPGEALMAHIEGDEDALRADTSLNTQGVQRNMALMQEFKIDVTPFIIYKDSRGEIKIIRGRPGSPDTLIGDLP